MSLNTDNRKEFCLRDGDSRFRKDWFFNHLDDIQSRIEGSELMPHDELIKLNNELNVDVDFEKILQNNLRNSKRLGME